MFNCDISKIPKNAGVYLFKDRKDTILYIGKAKNLQKRLWQYFSPTSLRKQEMLSKATKVDFLTTKNESEALYLEDNMIKQHQPEYNNLLKADNSYIYIKITKETFPQIFLSRKRINDGAIYIGPKNNTIQLKKFLQYLRQILKFRGCKTTQFRQGKLCSDYYFWLCRGRCKLAKTRENYTTPKWSGEQITRPTGANTPITHGKKTVQEYQDIVKTILSFFKGNVKPIEREIHEQLETAITQENFERAAQLRDVYTSLQWFVEKQDVVLPEKKDGYLAVITSIWRQRIYTVLVFKQGKLMDVITSKEQHSDSDEDSLHLAIQRTFGEWTITKNNNETIILGLPFSKGGGRAGGISWNNKKKLKIPLLGGETKRGLKPLLHLAENFLESYIISQSLQEESTMINDLMKTLQTRYTLKNIPYRIECIDISHLSGGRTSGGISCLVGGLPYKKWYRRYKIGIRHQASGIKQSDDYEALKEVIERRVKNGGELPNLLIIDGGKGQLGVVKKLYKNPERKKIVSQIDIISLGKGEARKKSNIWNFSRRDVDSSRLNKKITEKIYYFDSKLDIRSQDIVYDQADKILLKARDEAHRFANSYRKKQMSQEFKKKK